jgi:hypothetical protein
MTKKDTTPTIILELTPREAAAIHSLVWCSDWSKGDYGKECRDIAFELDGVQPSFNHHVAYVADENGIAIGSSFWLVDEANEDENLHSYSGA